MVNAENVSWTQLEKLFSATRLRHYLDEADGDRARAEQLYRWNGSLSAAFWEALADLEVALRNALDVAMTQRDDARGRTTHWIYDDARELGRDRGRGGRRHAQPYVDIDTAISRVRRNNKPLDPGQVISEISFGFWHQLVSRRQMVLWPDLASAFPHAPNRRQSTIESRIRRLRDLRNRIGHHHRIWALDIDGRYRDLLDLAGYLDPALGTWIAQRSRVPDLLSRRP